MPSSIAASALALEQPPETTRSRWPVFTLIFGLGTLWFICFQHLSAEWSYNEQYSYGWFVPFFALYLFWLRWEDRPRPAPEVSRQKSDVSRGHSLAAPKPGEGGSFVIRHGMAIAIAIGLLFLLLPIRLVEAANPDWRSVSWIHAFAAAGLTLLLIWRVGGMPWLKHFAFPVLFALVSVPWISVIEQPIIQGLMPTLASIATEALSLFGIPAEVQGNLIRINGGVVGVNEACSGVRSLQTSIMIGLLFGELKRLGVFQRVLLLVGAIAIAFVANCGRAFFLVWIAATRGLTDVEKWHDIAGYTIVGLVFFGCVGMTAWLARHKLESRKAKVEEDERSSDVREAARLPHFYFRNSTFYFTTALAWLVAVEIAVEVWYRSHERNLPRTAQWSVRWPASSPGYREIKIDDRTRAVLHFDKGKGAAWKRSEAANKDMASAVYAQPMSLLYFFRWEPGHNSALLANAHRPDVCLPATGWKRTQDLGVRNYEVSSGLTIPFRHFVFVHENAGRTQYAHAFYCVWEDRARPNDNAVAGDASTWNRDERFQAVLDGRRHLGQQVMEYLRMEPRAVDPSEAEQNFAEQVPQLIAPEEPVRR